MPRATAKPLPSAIQGRGQRPPRAISRPWMTKQSALDNLRSIALRFLNLQRCTLPERQPEELRLLPWLCYMAYSSINGRDVESHIARPGSANSVTRARRYVHNTHLPADVAPSNTSQASRKRYGYRWTSQLAEQRHQPGQHK